SARRRRLAGAERGVRRVVRRVVRVGPRVCARAEPPRPRRRGARAGRRERRAAPRVDPPSRGARRSARLSPEETGARIGLAKTLDAWAFVDALGPHATGEIIVSAADGPRGAVFVEAGRVCWSAARGLARRLTELLGARAQL